MMLDDYILGESDNLIDISTSQENREVALELVRQAKREVLIATYDLDAPVFSQENFIESLSAFVRGHRNAQTSILLQTPDKARKHGHRLVTLAQRLESHIHIHRPAPEHQGMAETFMVVDGIGYFKRQVADRYNGVASFKAPIVARDLRDEFLTMWERSTPEQQLRRLQI